MTLFHRHDVSSDADRRVRLRNAGQGPDRRASWTRTLAEFSEEMGILLRYATGRDYYDRRLGLPKD